MRHAVAAWACAALLTAPAAAQFQPLPGYNVGFNPNACLCPTTYMGEAVFYMVLPGDQAIATFYDPSTIPGATQVVELELIQWAVYEPRICAVGANMMFATTEHGNVTRVGLPAVYRTGWSYYKPLPPFTFDYRPIPSPSTWYLTYGMGGELAPPCHTLTGPEWEIYLVKPRFR